MGFMLGSITIRHVSVSQSASRSMPVDSLEAKGRVSLTNVLRFTSLRSVHHAGREEERARVGRVVWSPRVVDCWGRSIGVRPSG